ncbi:MULTISPECIES: lysozyme inhibitor LprI family protein [Pseudomonas]|uniref:lysozyme inhibitor LprI family protein n=1 Tax=Pseudomonas TaxID=286 RepID=UPI00235E5CD3|nr:lysozyme inhibitor LprI family protein [Pseudomonas asplenii]
MKKSLGALAALPLFIATAQAASFDCGRAKQPTEIAICSDRQLNDLDVEMATTYRLLRGLFAMGNRGAMQDEQVAWLQERNACGSDSACLQRQYDKRLTQLKARYDRIEKPL